MFQREELQTMRVMKMKKIYAALLYSILINSTVLHLQAASITVRGGSRDDIDASFTYFSRIDFDLPAVAHTTAEGSFVASVSSSATTSATGPLSNPWEEIISNSGEEITSDATDDPSNTEEPLTRRAIRVAAPEDDALIRASVISTAAAPTNEDATSAVEAVMRALAASTAAAPVPAAAAAAAELDESEEAAFKAALDLSRVTTDAEKKRDEFRYHLIGGALRESEITYRVESAKTYHAEVEAKRAEALAKALSDLAVKQENLNAVVVTTLHRTDQAAKKALESAKKEVATAAVRIAALRKPHATHNPTAATILDRSMRSNAKALTKDRISTAAVVGERVALEAVAKATADVVETKLAAFKATTRRIVHPKPTTAAAAAVPVSAAVAAPAKTPTDGGGGGGGARGGGAARVALPGVAAIAAAAPVPAAAARVAGGGAADHTAVEGAGIRKAPATVPCLDGDTDDMFLVGMHDPYENLSIVYDPHKRRGNFRAIAAPSPSSAKTPSGTGGGGAGSRS